MKRRTRFGKRIAAGLLVAILAVGSTPLDYGSIFKGAGVVALAEDVGTSEAPAVAASVCYKNGFDAGATSVTATWSASTDNTVDNYGTLKDSSGNTTSSPIQSGKTGTYESTSGVLAIDTVAAIANDTSTGKFDANKDLSNTDTTNKRIQVNKSTTLYVPVLGKKTVTTLKFTSGSYNSTVNTITVASGINSLIDYNMVWDNTAYTCTIISYTDGNAGSIKITFGSNTYLTGITSTSYKDVSATYASGDYTDGVKTAEWNVVTKASGGGNDGTEIAQGTSDGAYASTDGKSKIYVDTTASGAKLSNNGDWSLVGAGTILYLPVSGYKTVTEIELYNSNGTSDVEKLAGSDAKTRKTYVSADVTSSFNNSRVSRTITTYGDGTDSEIALVFSSNVYIGKIKITSYAATSISGTVAFAEGSDITALPDGLTVNVSFTEGTDTFTYSGAVTADGTEGAQTYSYKVDNIPLGASSYAVKVTSGDGTEYNITEGKSGYGGESGAALAATENTNNLTISSGSVKTYSVKVTLPELDEKFSSILKSENVIYTFGSSGITVSKTGSELFADEGDGLNLTKGTYNLTLSGEGLDKLPYTLTTDTIEVNADDTAFAVTAERVTEWKFGTNEGNCSKQLNTGSTAYYKGLYLNATSGKISAGNIDNSQFNTGAVITVPVVGPCKITVKTYTENKLTVGNTANTTANGYSNYLYTYTYTGKGEADVEIAATGDDYIYYIQVEPTELTYSVNVTFADGYQLSGAGDDAAVLTYTFINQSDGTTKTFNNSQMKSGTITLPDGTYTLSLSGSAINEIPYRLADSSKSVTVNVPSTDEAGGAINIALERINEWLFGHEVKDGFVDEINGKKGWFNGLEVDATGGKLSAKSTDRKTNAQINANTIIKIPVSSPCIITVATTQGTYKIGTTITDDTETVSGTFTYTYMGNGSDDEKVQLSSLENNGYITSIKVEEIATATISGDVTLSGSDADATGLDALKVIFTKADSDEKYEASVTKGDGSTYSYSILLPASEGGITYNMSMSDVAYEISGNKIVTAKTNTDIANNDITLTYNKTYDLKVLLGKNADKLTDVKSGLSFTFTPENGNVVKCNYGETTSVTLKDGVAYTVTVEGLSGSAYTTDAESYTVSANAEIKELTINFVMRTQWAFGSSRGYNQFLQGNGKETIGSYQGLVIDATNGKLDGKNQTERAQFNANTVIKVPVEGACTVTVTTQVGTYTVNGVAATGTTFAYIYPGEAGYVTVKATANDYITDIVVTKGGVESATVSGSVTNTETLPDDLQLVFTNSKDSSKTYYATIADGKYSIKLAADTDGTTEYKISTNSVEYDVQGDVTLSVNKDETKTQNITVVKKEKKSVKVQLGSGPTLTDVTFRFTLTDGDDVYYDFNYTEMSSGTIKLYDGTYRVSLIGDAYHKDQSYRVTSDMQLTVGGSENSFVMTFEEATTWKLNGKSGDTDDYNTLTIQKTTGYYNGLWVNADNGKFSARLDSGDTQVNNGTVINVPVTGACTVTVTAKDASYAPYLTVGDVTGTTASASVSYKYTGNEGYVQINVAIEDTSKSAYLASISVVYQGNDTANTVQSAMPYVDDGTLTGSKKDSMSVDAVGQKLKLTQTGGAYDTTTTGVSYYVFPAVASSAVRILEFDVVINESSGTSSNTGFFGGLFTANNQYTIAMRKASTSVKGTYTKNGGYSSASGNEYTIALGTKVHYTVTINDDGKAVVTASFVDADGVSQTAKLSQTMASDGNVYYGMAMADSSAVVTNMKYYSIDEENNETIYYYQNDAYAPKGTAPVPTSVTAVSASGTTISEYIKVSWVGDIAENDGYYELYVRKNDTGEFEKAATDIVENYYYYKLEPATTASYTFKVVGVLGKASLGGTESASVVSAQTQQITGQLAAPVVTAESSTESIILSWDEDTSAAQYLVYRYSYDDGAGNAKLLTTITDKSTTTYTDSAVDQEMPYYYYVIAKNSAGNTSDASETVWGMATKGHSGTYVYEDDAAEIFIAEKSYDTVFSATATLKGNVYNINSGGTLVVKNNTNNATNSVTISKSGDEFEFSVTLAEGRNDVELLYTDSQNNVTRETYNFVYLTNYDIVVDSSYKGTDGEKTDGVPYYKTIQAAVNSVDSNNADRVVILVMAGDYKERLVVDKPNVTIIGQDRENTLVHCYPADTLGTKAEAGGDMDKRCATYIMSAATNFNAENISFKNDYDYSTADGKSNKSADALRCDADGATFVNVKLTSVQDTLYMDKGNQFYYKCRIEGLVDYIYSGEAARALFDDCELVFLYQSTKTAGYVCAPKTTKGASYGLTFTNCVVTGEEGCSGNGYLLARPWGADAYVTWINCYMGKSVYTVLPYADMNGSYSAANFYEYGTYGPGFAVNADRRQISTAKAESMTTDSYLGWAPYTTIIERAKSYVGSMTTTGKDDTATSERVNYTYEQTDGDDTTITNIARYNQEGFASVYGVTGGGLQKEDTADYDNPNYYKVGTAEEFLKALVDIKSSGKASAIELTADLNLGCNEVANFSDYSSVIKAYEHQALLHPTLITSGVSVVTITNMHNLTIFSQNGSSIKHANITFKNSSNIIVRNIKFDELWEWDEYTEGGYDRNDWDYMTIDTGSDGIWVDHCTFYKAYDGVIDVKNPVNLERVTISWCEFLPGSEGDTFFDEMMNLLKSNPTKYAYYNKLLTEESMTTDEIRSYAYGQKKTHLFGQSAEATNAKGIRVTLANNVYTNSMDRMPRLRYGVAHVYNCIMDASTLFTAKIQIATKSADVAKHIVSNGVSSTCNGSILVENSYINNIINALNSGNGSDDSGYINAINSLYYIQGTRYALEPKVNTTMAGAQLKTLTDTDSFISSLGYSYNLRNAANLNTTVASNAGAGKLSMTPLQWEKTKYNATYQSEGDTGTYTNEGLDKSPYVSDATGDDNSDEGYDSDADDEDDEASGGNGNNDSSGDNNTDDDNKNTDNNGSGDDSSSSDGSSDSSSDSSGSDSDSSSDNSSSSDLGLGGSDSSGSSDSISDSSDSGSGSGSGNSGSGSTDSSDGTLNTTPVSDIITADEVPGASVVTVGGVEFMELGGLDSATNYVLSSIDAGGNIKTNDAVNYTPDEIAAEVDKQYNVYNAITLFASEDTSVSADVINRIAGTDKVLAIGVVGSDGTVKAVVTLDGSLLSTANTGFDLKVSVDVASSSVAAAAANNGMTMDNYMVIDFSYSGNLPGTFKVDVDVSGKFVDGTQLALYYNDTQAGRLENQYQVCTVSGGFAQFAINHCSEYVLVDMSAAGSKVASSTLSAPKTADSNYLMIWLASMGFAAALFFGFEAAGADRKRAKA